jgi:adenylate cyclase
MLALQDEIAEAVAGAIEPELLKKEGQRAARKPPQNPTAWDLVRRGMWEFFKVRPESHRVARDLILKAIAAAPENADGYIWLARIDAGLVVYGWSEDPQATSTEGMAAALRAVQHDEKNPYSHYAVAITHIGCLSGQLERARKAAERAIALSPSFALGHLVLGVATLLSGQPREAIPELRYGLRLNAFDPHSFGWHFFLALAHYLVGQAVQGLEEAKGSLEIRPHWSPALKVAAACEVALGNRLAARQLVMELEAQGETDGDLLVTVAMHLPEQVSQLNAVLWSLTSEPPSTVREP